MSAREPRPPAGSPMHGPVGALQALARVQPGAVVADRFAVESLADWGGMGAVYRATDRHTGESVALKIVLDAATDDRFAREVRILAELVHPRIVKYVAHGRTDSGSPFLVMEWLEGTSLRQVLSNGALTLHDALAVTRGVAEALAVAHARGVVHRDVNPRNVFVPTGRIDLPKMLDFGIARPSHATWALTVPGAQLGTPGYMAPEQARGETEVDARADVFALGCVLYECLAGRPAFAADNMMALLSKVLLEDSPRIVHLRPVPPRLDELLRAMLNKDPSGRPRDAQAVLDALSRLDLTQSDDLPPPAHRPPSSIGDNEQRLVSVVMAGPSSERAVQSDAATLESGADPLGRARLGKFGAKIEWLADGSMVATLTADGDATDHAAQAARLALVLRDVVHGPIALATGRGVVTGRTAVGEALERAARLLQSVSSSITPRGEEILVDEVTAGLLDLRFDVVDAPHGRTLRGTRDSADSTRTVLGRVTTCIGRDRDLAMLEATFTEAVDEPAARAVLLTGAAGVGKSRVRRELLRRIRKNGQQVEVLYGRADPMSAGAPFAMLADAIRGAAGVTEGEPIAVRRQKLLARVGRHVPEDDRTRVAEFLGEMIGAHFPEENSVQLQAARRDPMLRGDQMRRAWEDWIRAESAHKPLLVILEDLHWGDLPTVRIIDATLRNLHDRPLMVLALARPEVHELFPDVWESRGAAELRLGPLTKKACERLVREVLGEATREEDVRRIVESSAGNAFCLEEMIRAHAEGRNDATPGTVLATVHARLERLSSGARRVLRAASVFGETFWRRGVVALVGGDARAREVAEWLSYLVDHEIVAARSSRKFPGEDELGFQHALLREAAYASLTAEDRALGHRLAAKWLDAVGEGDALTLALHHAEGGETAEAIRWWLRAAEQALEGGDLEATIARAQRAIDAGAEGESLGALRLLQAEAHKWRGANADAKECALSALASLKIGSARWCAAAGEVAAASGKIGDRTALDDVAQTLLALDVDVSKSAAGDLDAFVIAAARTATQLGLVGKLATATKLLERLQTSHDRPAVAAWVLEARAVCAGAGEDPAARVKLAQAAGDAFEHAGDMRNACLQKVSVGHALVEIGAFSRAERTLREALAIGERMALDNANGIAQAQLGRALARTGSLDEGRAMLLRAVGTLEAQKNVRLEGIARSWLAVIDLERGDVESAERFAARAVEMLAIAPALRAHALATLARVQLAKGANRDAVKTSKDALDTLESAGKSAIGESHVRLVRHLALAAIGDEEGAREALHRAKERLFERAAKIVDPELREGFLARPENAKIAALASS